MGFHRILALTDLSEASRPGVSLSDALARRLHARVTVGYVHTRGDVLRDLGKSRDEAKRLRDWVRRDEEEHLRHFSRKHVDRLRLESVETIEDKTAREGVLRLIERIKPDLVCMATRGRTGVSHLLLGSIAEHTLRTSEVPVMVTKGAPFPDAESRLRLLVGLDLIDDPANLARRAVALLTPTDEMILAHVVETWADTPSHYGSELSLAQPDIPGLKRAAIERMETVDLGENAPARRVAITAGRPGEGLLSLERQHEPHLLVVRTHGRRGFDRMMLGSVSEYLARKAVGSVLVFPKID